MNRNIFIGGAWPYANNSLHVGHLAALLPADVIARYYRLNGDNVIYVSGTDSHGTPITVRARKENVSPDSIAEKYHSEFVKNFNDLDFSYDLYTTTMTDYHAEHVKAYLKRMYDNGFIYEKEEEQDFCPSCNTFLSDREIIGVCPHCHGVAKGDQCDSCLATLSASEVLDKKCANCGSTTILKPNKHLYFALSKFQDKIKKLTDDHANIWRYNAVNETYKFLDMGLIDRAVTRQLEWGIDVPFEHFEDKKIYVWIEAVLGYLTAGNKVADDRGIDFEKFMQKGNVTSYYVHGKDNIPFHTVIYPSLLMAIDENIDLPDHIISCEYVNMNNEKMSKSKGNLISINELTSMFDKDSIRYFMLANGPENKDTNFSMQDFITNHNKFLVGTLGNFVNRNLSFMNKKFDGKICEGKIDENIKALTKDYYNEIGSLIERGKIKSAIEKAFDYVSEGNRYYSDRKPWEQVNNDIDEFNNTTYTCVYMMANMANMLMPFIPHTCERIKAKLALDFAPSWKEVEIKGNLQVQNNELLFERLQ